MGSEQQTVLKCKCCGDTLLFAKGAKVCICESCGSSQTLPSSVNKFDDYARADMLRRKFQFDEAMIMYSQIIHDDPEDPEGYWNYLLCKYGVEYVQDGNEHKPTIHRTQQRSIKDEEDYADALRYADDEQKALYEKEAEEIDRINATFQDICNNDEYGNYDVFISYKETDPDTGEKTQDYREAYDLYTDLKRDGYKVFLSAVSLKAAAGSDYEPYIYAALSSAKVMVLFGLKKEYMLAPWVRNEWCRFNEMIKNDRHRFLIAVCNLADKPAELGHKQVIDTSKMGYDVDLREAVRKRLGPKEDPYQAKIGQGLSKADVKKRIDKNLRAGKWDDVIRNARTVLEMDRTDAEAYLARLLAVNRVGQIAELKTLNTAVYETDDFKNAAEYGSEEIKKSLAEAEAAIKENVNARKQREKLLSSMYAVSATLLHNYDTTKNKIALNDQKIAEFKKDKPAGINPAAIIPGFLITTVVIVVAWVALLAIPATSHMMEPVLNTLLGSFFESMKEKLTNGWYILFSLFGFPIMVSFFVSIIIFIIIPLIGMIIGGVNKNKTIARLKDTGEDLKRAMQGFADALTAVFAYTPMYLRNEAALNELNEVYDKKEEGQWIEDYAAQPALSQRYKCHEDFRKVIYKENGRTEDLLAATQVAFDTDRQYNTPAFRSMIEKI